MTTPQLRSLADLRRRAEAVAQHGIAPAFSDDKILSPARIQEVLYELRVHQIELEMQNEKLCRSQLALDIERERYFDLYDLAPVGYCTVDTQGLIRNVNLTAAQQLGLSRQELLNQPFQRFILLADQDVYQLHRNQILIGAQAQSCELQMLPKEGAPFWVRLMTTLMPDGVGEPVMRIALSDISVSKKLEFALADVQSELMTAQRIGGIVNWSFDVDSGAVLYSSAALFGDAEPSAVRPTSYKDLQKYFSAESLTVLKAATISCLTDGRPYHCDAEVLRADGSKRWINIFSDSVKDRSGRVVRLHGMVQDITERKQMESQLQLAMAQADQANRAKSRFLAAASHDLRQPLAALALYVDVLQSRVTPDNSNLVSRIHDCCDNLTALLTDLLDMSKLDASVVKPSLTHFPIDAFIANLVSVHSAEANLKGLGLRWRHSQAFAHTDSQLLQRIAGNFVVNAIRYTNRGGILIAHRRHAGKNWLEVWDTGIGIPADKTDFIFEEFSQLRNESDNQGSGLGLAIVAKLAALLGLQIRMRSKVGQGSMFAIELPIGQAPVVGAQLPLRLTARRLQIALVEDNPHVRAAIALSLESMGHTVIASRNGVQLLEQLGQQKPDIIISDYRLEAGETGFDVITAVRAAFGADLPALIITGDTDPALIRSMSQRGIAVQYKPLQLNSLLAFAHEAIERRPA